MSKWYAAAFFVLQSSLLWWGVGAERPPSQADFQRLPARLGEWSLAGEDPDQATVKRLSRADETVARYYTDPGRHLLGHVLVAWYRSQRGGSRQPHQPAICLTASGWRETRTASLNLGRFEARCVHAERRGAASEIIYWYQTRRRALGSEWAAKWWLILDAVRDRRTDGALVRVTVNVEPGRDRECETAALRLATTVQEEVVRLWPR